MSIDLVALGIAQFRLSFDLLDQRTNSVRNLRGTVEEDRKHLFRCIEARMFQTTYFEKLDQQLPDKMGVGCSQLGHWVNRVLFGNLRFHVHLLETHTSNTQCFDDTVGSRMFHRPRIEEHELRS